MSLGELHGYKNSVRWRLTPKGVAIDGYGIERTRGRPATATRIWETYGDQINDVARKTRVPCELILATICTESYGRSDVIRLEPGYKSDTETPHRISVGLMQTLISTAQSTMKMSFDRNWLLDSYNSILAGASYMAEQARKTNFDPPLVAAAYNAGGLYDQNGRSNRWKLRQYPIGTGKHCDRFIQFFNDGVFVLSTHSKRAAVSIMVLLGSAPAPRPRPAPRNNNRIIEVRFASRARKESVTEYSLSVLKDILGKSGLSEVLISSTSRDPYNQARVMYDNLERYGVDHQKRLYGRYGDKVIDVYAAIRVVAGLDREKTIQKMKDKVVEVGPTNVSRHAANPRVLNVFDVAPSSIKNHQAFEKNVQNDPRVKTFFMPPKDPGYHLEIPQLRG